MSKTNNKNKVRKGDYGYIAAEKKKRILITAALFAAPLLIFFSAMIYFKTRLTVWTVIAVVGCLPACKSVVSLIMIFRAKPVAPQVYQEISKHAGELVMSYEMYMTFYEKSASIDAFAICGNTVVGFSSDPKIDARIHGTGGAEDPPRQRIQGKCQDLYQTAAVSGTSGFHERAQRIPGRRN